VITLLPAVLAAVLAAAAPTSAQEAPRSPQQLFEAGQYPAALQAMAEKGQQGGLGPADHYLAAQIDLRLTPPDAEGARRELTTLAGMPEQEWAGVGRSAIALMDDNVAQALEAASAAVALAPASFYPQYQLGLVKAKAEDWAGAADAFEKASQVDPTFAYAHYYAGIAYSRLKRADLEATHFDAFIRLAPDAPERLGVESIMRTLRGR